MSGSDWLDLWEFWGETKDELAAVSLEPERTPLPEHSTPQLSTYRVNFVSLPGVRVNGYYTHHWSWSSD